jgi:hypothetical protein
MELYGSVMPDAPVFRFMLAFYNRILAADLSEAQCLLRIPLPVSGNTEFRELAWQSALSTDVGSVLMQVAVASPDERTPEQYLAVNNIIRYELPAITPFKSIVGQWRAWFDHAHDVARQIFWDSLTPAAQESWRESDPK